MNGGKVLSVFLANSLPHIQGISWAGIPDDLILSWQNITCPFYREE